MLLFNASRLRFSFVETYADSGTVRASTLVVGEEARARDHVFWRPAKIDSGEKEP